eukprot:CAMPEP_0174825456 /NCGR_PEP_ID=MMETSP1107-20130205/42770_1 /TAXON_ID=36770 /ORGANISM="Paraphysomonas vestita, Strain GFlagA" /LENGTH=196 /DNA_ID=CAMNT_0016057081 /DNA_START=186 /DNA_END=776 /DNA_ORIENTATION=-
MKPGDVTLGGNIDIENAEAICQNLEVNNRKTSIFLKNFPINQDVKNYMIEMLSNIKRRVITIDLRNNQIGSNGANAICEMLKINDTIDEINLLGNKIEANEALRICELITDFNKEIRCDIQLNKYYLELDLPQEFSKQSNENILAFLKERKRSGENEVFRVRCMVVGPPAVGKTTLIHKLIKNEFIESQFSMTDGV